MTPSRALVVDDSPVWTQALAEILTGGGIEVVGTASNSHQAMQSVHLADLAFVDIYLGDDDGRQVAQALRSVNPDLSCFLMSAQPWLEPADPWFISKGVGSAELFEIVDRGRRLSQHELPSTSVPRLRDWHGGQGRISARGIHDGPLQAAAAALQRARLASKDAQDAVAWARQVALLEETVDGLRALLTGASRPADPADEILARLRAEAGDFRIDLFAVDGLWVLLGNMPTSATEPLLEFIAEAVRNAYRHSGGTQARVSLNHHDGLMVVTIDDDGAGRDVRPAPRPGHLGAALQVERAQQLNATLSYSPSPLGGLRVELELPDPRLLAEVLAVKRPKRGLWLPGRRSMRT